MHHTMHVLDASGCEQHFDVDEVRQSRGFENYKDF